jgi:predicted TIM-barrel fold metal-dependent hydrolase
MNRRTFLGAAVSSAALDLEAQGSPMPIIDTHIHLFDPTSSQGVPWPEKGNKDDEILYRPALPNRYRQLTQGLGIVGVIEVECSPWLEDNQWVLDLAAKDSLIVGTVGDLEPGKPDFRKHLERFHRNPLFRGIRCGNLWGRNLAAGISREDYVSDIKGLADAGLGMDTVDQSTPIVAAVVHLTDKVPSLRVVLDHLPQTDPPAEPAARKERETYLRELAARPQIFVKLSEILRRVNGNVPTDLESYRSRLDEIWGIFGEDRIIFGSDWPNSDRWGSFQQVFNLARDYVKTKGKAVEEKFYWKNSTRAYNWIKRAANQPHIK